MEVSEDLFPFEHAHISHVILMSQELQELLMTREKKDALASQGA